MYRRGKRQSWEVCGDCFDCVYMNVNFVCITVRSCCLFDCVFCVGLCIAEGRDSPRKFVVIVLTVYLTVYVAVHHSAFLLFVLLCVLCWFVYRTGKRQS